MMTLFGAVEFSVGMSCHPPRQARTKGLIEVNWFGHTWALSGTFFRVKMLRHNKNNRTNTWHNKFDQVGCVIVSDYKLIAMSVSPSTNQQLSTAGRGTHAPHTASSRCHALGFHFRFTLFPVVSWDCDECLCGKCKGLEGSRADDIGR